MNNINRTLMAKKKLLTLFFALCCAGSLFASDIQVDGIWYDFDPSTKTASVTYKGKYSNTYNNEYSGSIIIPQTVIYNSITYSVTKIGNSAFRECSNLTSITIPSSVTTIGDGAFYACSGLTSITIPHSVTTIGNWAFEYCSGLTSVTIPNSVTTIGKSAFSGCESLTSVNIPNSVTTIEYGVFWDCKGLTSVTIPNSVITIGEGAFVRCKGLTSITIPSCVTTIGKSAFSGCSGLTSVTIPNSVKTIGESAFSGCKSLTLVTIPNSVTTIGKSAFSGCESLTSVNIPNSVTSIGGGPFGGCTHLTSINVDAANVHYCLMEGVLFNHTKDTLIQYPMGNTQTEYTIPNSVTTIGDEAFYECSALKSITIPNSVTTIGKWAFASCHDLTSITIPNSVKTIGSYAFWCCFDMSSITIPKSITTIEEGTFFGSGLTSATILNPNVKIERWVFENCTITDLYCGPSVDFSQAKGTKGIITNIHHVDASELIFFLPFDQYAKDFVVPRINEWQKKKEFEKTSDWQARVNETTRKQQIDFLVQTAKKDYLTIYKKYRSPIFTLGTYDADNEVYIIHRNKGEDLLLAVPLAKASYVKQNWASCKASPQYDIQGTEVVVTSVDFKFPNKKTYTYKSNQNLTYAQADIQYNFDPIEIDLGSNTSAPQPKGQQTIEQKQLTIGKSAVDINIPQTGANNTKTFVIILANEDYESVAPVPFAKNDGNTFKKYCINTLGIPEQNIHLRENATLNNMRSELGWLKQVCDAYNGEASVIFYYAGHGIPDENDKSAYLLPTDGDGRYVQSGYKLDDLYSRLGSLSAKSVTVFMDACFSGSQRGSGMLASARGVALKAKSGVPQGNMVVFSAAQGDETAYPNNDEGHGMFSYYLLKKLQETKGNVTLKDLGDYITTNVRQQSIVLNSKSQTPCVTPSHAVADSWQTWKLK